MVESQIVDLVVVGSKPTRHPDLQSRSRCSRSDAFVAQLDRATDFESVGCTFEPCRTQKKIGRLAQLVEQQTLNLWVGSSILPSLNTELTLCAWHRSDAIRESGEIGRHARLRIWCPWREGSSPFSRKITCFDNSFLRK